MSERVKEVTDSSFETEVLKSDQPVLVDFWAEWCGPCRMLAPVIEAVAEEYWASASVVRLNVDDNPVSAGNYGIKGIPTMILFNQGKEVERIVGVTGKESIGRMIEKHARLEAPKHKAA